MRDGDPAYFAEILCPTLKLQSPMHLAAGLHPTGGHRKSMPPNMIEEGVSKSLRRGQRLSAIDDPDDFSNIIESGMSTGLHYVDIKASDKAFKTQSCQPWVQKQPDCSQRRQHGGVDFVVIGRRVGFRGGDRRVADQRVRRP